MCFCDRGLSQASKRSYHSFLEYFLVSTLKKYDLKAAACIFPSLCMYKLNAFLDLGPNGGRVSSLDVVAALFLMPTRLPGCRAPDGANHRKFPSPPHRRALPPSCPATICAAAPTRTHICPCLHGVDTASPCTASPPSPARHLLHQTASMC